MVDSIFAKFSRKGKHGSVSSYCRGQSAKENMQINQPLFIHILTVEVHLVVFNVGKYMVIYVVYLSKVIHFKVLLLY